MGREIAQVMGYGGIGWLERKERIKEEDPALSHKLLTYFVSVMAERLTFANRTIAVLRR